MNMSILKRINYYWRLIATAISFSLFGIGGVIIPVISTPILFLIARGQRRRQLARRLVHLSFKTFIYMMRALGILRWDIRGLEKLQRSSGLVLANHPTLIDVVFLVALIPNASCIVKGKLLSNPAMRGFITLAGYITNDGGDDLLDSVKADAGILIVFPEGTRSTAGQALRMQRGAANIAIRSNTNITPIIIRCEPITLSKQHKWYHIPDRPFAISIDVKDDISIAQFTEGPATLGARRLTKYLERYFSQESQPYEHTRNNSGAESPADRDIGLGRHLS